MSKKETAIAEAAMRSSAQKRLDRIEEIRVAHTMAAEGLGEGEIAGVLTTTQKRVRRMLRAKDHAETSPEEMILRATVEGSDRDALVRRLSLLEYTFRVYAPDPAEGANPGSWDQVKQAYLTGLLTKEEYLAVLGAVTPVQEEQ